MNFNLKRCFIIILSIIIFLPSHYVDAASTVSVKTKVLSYKGQKYIQLTGGNKKTTDKINKTLKTHALTAAKLDTDLKKQSKQNFYKTSPSTKFNKNERLSIVYTDSAFTGGVHEIYSTYTYNFNLSNGNVITLGDVAKSTAQISNLVVSISAGLSIQKSAGIAIYDESIDNYPIGPDSTFYFYDGGIVVRFSPYEVAPFSEGFIDVKVPYTALNATPFTSSENTPIVPTIPVTSGTIESKIDDDFEGYEEGNLYELANGQIWKQVDYKYSYRYSYRPDVLIYKDGSRYYMKVDGMKDKVQVERIK
ncbi:DUF3298 domain-containing protein [Paenibacillus sp. CFBP 13594]|uniref:DUF3298 and DUF4163 domain-containing protein n=1 Tax=Paenibacillus sp. CFBP 13594 TaxID=2774037 RepID=UPI001783FF24|nr:DUF3298 and DUF4163 domain-containing protein [Paenibacillus sp. CFBP 13594]MBD8838872.1 DUF3298 domain-containing protein [Paenibacillus sp. CFBP 13594]